MRRFPKTIGFGVLTDIRPAGLPEARPTRSIFTALTGHRLFAAVLTLAAALRVVTMLGYRPAQLYWYDSFTYLDAAVHLKPSFAFHPIGYPLLLRVLWPFHSVGVIAGVQHAMGLGTGVMIYALLRRRSLPAWGAALATVPVLFDASFLRLEHAVLSDTQFIFLIVAGLTTLMWSPELSTRAATGAGLLFAMAALTRTIALPLLLLVLVLLAVRRVGWRPLAAAAIAGILPLVAYAGWYDHHYGRFALNSADGVALWARTMTFADCAVLKPPADQRVTPAFGFAHGSRPLPEQPLIGEVKREYDPGIRGLYSVRPYADLLIAYQYPAYLRGPPLGAILLLGAAGAVLRRRAVLLPWGVAVALLVAPVAVLDFDHRYVLPVVPIACLAAALAVRELVRPAIREPVRRRPPRRRPARPAG
ncbi:hypothetical protein [Streptosporangium sp. NPDC000396]|uniref:hypothetical protein n=1 Tax=Streptosporangium sp. NPDC000396 TaxID=3366185 RepID=UPI003694DEF4